MHWNILQTKIKVQNGAGLHVYRKKIDKQTYTHYVVLAI